MEDVPVIVLRAAQAGRLSDLAEISRVLAAKYGADACCPVIVQRHLVRFSEGSSALFWRVVDPTDCLRGT